MDSKAITPSSLSAQKLIVFCDGTWCGPEHGTRTNIQLLAEMAGIDMHASRGSREIQDASRRLRAKYVNGITCNYLTYGLGASPDNIGRLCLEIYRYIARAYGDGTEIWLFGLGRGAYALRCVVGMIDNCGIVKTPTDELCNLVYQTYTSLRENDNPSSDQSTQFRARASWDVVAPVKIMVLLDSVGSVGHGKIQPGFGSTTKDKRSISWADESNHNTKPLQIEPKPVEDPSTPLPSPRTAYKDHINISSPSFRRDSADPRPRHQRSSSLLQSIVLTASDNTLMEAVINSDITLVQDILAQKASKLAFDFEWLGELIELGSTVEEIAAVLIEEEKDSPWLIVSGGNFGKRALKMAKRLERKKGPGKYS
ncbi:hypothetical protein E4T49_03057 [Aureobasidium sp. EXF-10728]|nr:hypothetical protein E4T49_03057 [Aureobasidium sp. EXF-10728]